MELGNLGDVRKGCWAWTGCVGKPSEMPGLANRWAIRGVNRSWIESECDRFDDIWALGRTCGMGLKGSPDGLNHQ